jgi:predicted ATPase
MLTRLTVNGFKNLDNLDIRFGPFTCVAGANGVGKSNLFDAISFLSHLADKSLTEAALAVRGGSAKQGSVKSLFRRRGEIVADSMSFLAEFIIPTEGGDDLGQIAQASMTFLRYELELRHRPEPGVASGGQIEIVRESMVHLNKTSAKKNLSFRHTKAWRDSVVKGRRTSPYISTNLGGIVSLHADAKHGHGGGRPRKIPAARLPRTMLSSVNNAVEHRTLVLAKQEMMSWFELHLEPSCLRSPDPFTAPRTVSPIGANLPATLYSLAQSAEAEEQGSSTDLFARVANRLSELIEDIGNVHVDVDDKRQLLSIVMTDRNQTEHMAASLSDGTLRFLALTVMEVDPRNRSLMCLEEPENGIHPIRIPAMIDLLQDLAVDPHEAVDGDNPLRQVIVNTHSPSVVACIPDDALLVACSVHISRRHARAGELRLQHLPETWRHDMDPEAPIVARGKLLAYLNPFAAAEDEARRGAGRRVIDRHDLQLGLFRSLRKETQ